MQEENNKVRIYASKKNIYKYFGKYGYTEEQVDKAILRLSKKQREKLYNYYGRDLHNPKINENLEISEIKYIKNAIFKNIRRKLNNPNTRSYNSNVNASRNIYEYFMERGYSEEQVDYVILKLVKRQREALYNYYGGDLHNPKTKKRISSKDKKYVFETVFVIIEKRLYKMNLNENSINVYKKFQRHISIDNLYEYFKEYGYTEEQVDEVIPTLVERQREALYNYYGKDLHNPKINENISDNDRKYILQTVVRTIKKKIDKLCSNSAEKLYTRISKSNIYEYFKVYGYNEEQVDKAVLMLTERQREALYNYYGGDLHNPRINKNKSLKLYIKYTVFTSIKLRLEILFPNNLKTENTNKLQSKHNNSFDNIEVISDEETFGSEIENIQDIDLESICIQSIIEQLYKNNISIALSLIDKYLDLNKNKDYFELIINFLKISIIEGDNDYFKVITILKNIKSVNLYDLLANNIQSFYVALSCNDLELTGIYLDVIIMLDKLGAECVLKNNFEKIYKLSKCNEETGRLKDFNESLLKYKTADSSNGILENSDDVPKIRIIN